MEALVRSRLCGDRLLEATHFAAAGEPPEALDYRRASLEWHRRSSPIQTLTARSASSWADVACVRGRVAGGWVIFTPVPNLLVAGVRGSLAAAAGTEGLGYIPPGAGGSTPSSPGCRRRS
jgi:hypothetical protein